MAVEKLEIETYFGKCKCCLNYGYLRTMWEQHVVEEKAEIYGQMLMQCFSIPWIRQGSEEDDQICEDCIWKLREAYMFKEQVLRCQKEIEECVEDDLEEAIELKSEPDNENYVVEYLEEELLDVPNSNVELDEDGDSKESLDDRESHDDDISQDDDDKKNTDDENYNEAHDPLETEDKDFQEPRKRKPRPKDDLDSDTEAPKPKWPKKLPRDERYKTYKQYTMDTLKSAVEAVTSRQMNQKQAAKHYKVPRKTLSAKVRQVKNEASNERPLTPDDPIDNQENEDAMLVIKKHRENIHSVLAYSNATPIRGYWGKGYVCAFCPEQFIDPSALKTHSRNHGNLSRLYKIPHVRTHVTRLDVTGLKCRLCNTKIEDLKTLMSHLRNQHERPMHFDINNHLVPFVFATKELGCAECGNQFRNFKFLSEHMANVHYRNYVCGKCDRGFVNKVNLIAHKDTHKTGAFYCDFCRKVFDTRRKKTTHERQNHIIQTKTVKCGYCKMRFLNAAQKNNHEMRSHKKQQLPFSCNSCDKSYVRSRSLRDHVNKEHLQSRPYKCRKNGCDKAFYLNKTLQAHILTHDDARPFECELCPKTYRSEKSLKEHMYIHNDRKEFKCPKCYKSYVLKENLTRHLKEKH